MIKYFNLTVFILLRIFEILCKISPEDINTVIESIEKDEIRKKLMKSSIINPIYGYLFEATGVLNNIRFYGPFIKSEKDKENVRQYAKDSSDDDLVKLSILLFPSPTGTLCHIRNIDSNFGSKIKQKIADGVGVEFMSKLFLQLLKKEIDISFSEIIDSVEITEVIDIIKSEKQSQIFSSEESQIIKIMMLNSFVINILDDEEDLRGYLKIILEKITNIEELPHLSINVIEQVLFLRKYYSGFPYSDLNQPPSNSRIHIYDRKNEKFIHNELFSDCVDVLLLNICNCLFYDSVNFCYSLEKLPENSAIYKFYQRHTNLFTITDEIREEWSKVIQDLDDFPIEDDSKYKLNKIQYVLKNMRNELNSGIINMMNVLIRICNIDHGEFWRDFKGKQNISEKIEKLFTMLSAGNCTISLGKSKFEEEKIDKRMEVLGKFDVRFECSNGIDVGIVVGHSDRHAEMIVSKYEIDSEKVQNIQEVNVDNLLGTVYMNFALRCRENIDKSNILNSIYFSKPIQTNEQKIEVLREIFESIAENNTQEGIEILKGITISILETVELNDQGTRNLFDFYFVYFDCLTDSEILKCWKKSLETDDDQYVYQVWKLRVQNIKTTEIEFDLTSIKRSRIQSFFETLSGIESLENLKFKGRLMNENISDFAEGLNILTHLKKLEMHQIRSNEVMKLVQIKSLSTAFLKMTNLTSLSLSLLLFRDMEIEFYEELLTSLTQLSELRLSNICLTKSEIECFSEVMTSKLGNLIGLEISFEKDYEDGSFEVFTKILGSKIKLTELKCNNLKLKDMKRIELFSEAIGHLENLKILHISSCEFASQGIEDFILNLGKSNQITELALTKINSEEKWIFYLSRAISSLSSLIKLDISQNSFASYDSLVVLLQNMKKMINLKCFNISSCKIKESHGIENFATAIGNLIQITEFNVSYIQLDDQNLKFLTEAIASLKNLKILNFLRNKPNITAQSDLLKTIKSSVELRSLTISFLGNLSTPESQSLLKQLVNLTQLNELEILSNESIDRKYLIEALRKLKKLKTLIIRDNVFRNKEIKLIIGALRDLKNLSSILIRGKQADYSVLSEIKKMFSNLQISTEG